MVKAIISLHTPMTEADVAFAAACAAATESDAAFAVAFFDEAAMIDGS